MHSTIRCALGILLLHLIMIGSTSPLRAQQPLAPPPGLGPNLSPSLSPPWRPPFDEFLKGLPDRPPTFKELLSRLPDRPSKEQLEKLLQTRPGPRELLVILAKCAQGSCPEFDEAGKKTSHQISEALTKDLVGLIDHWEKHVRYCVGRVSYKENLPQDIRTAAPFPGKEKDATGQGGKNATRPCDDHDMTLFNGLLCYAGDERGCNAVKNSQVTNEADEAFYGSWWRSPMSIKIDRKVAPGTSASMSEEQTWGVFLYLMKTRDKDAFYRWVNWIGKKNRDEVGLPRWCTDPNKAGECNFLPLECIAFEELARQFDPNNPVAAINVSQTVGCDRVMGVTYGAAAGVLGLLLHFKEGLPLLMSALPAAIATDPEIKKIAEDAARNPASAPQMLPDFLAKVSGYLPPDDLDKQVEWSTVPVAPPPLCLKDIADQLRLPWLGSSVTGPCIVPPPIFDARIPVPKLPSIASRAPGYTTGFPVQLQVLVEAIVTDPGYGLHKVGARIFLLQQLGYDNETLKKAASRYFNKTVNNAFALYLIGHDNAAAQMVKDKCPAVDHETDSRHQWVWERDEREETKPLFEQTAYWDCIFATKLLVSKAPARPPVMAEMQRAQVEAVRAPFTNTCEDFKSSVSATAQSARPGDDYQIVFTGQPVTNYPEKHWYQDATFVAPCSGWYSAEISVTGFKAPQGSLKLVRTWRYGKPVEVKDTSRPAKASFFLDQYDAIGLVIAASEEVRAIDGARLTLRWQPQQPEDGQKARPSKPEDREQTQPDKPKRKVVARARFGSSATSRRRITDQLALPFLPWFTKSGGFCQCSPVSVRAQSRRYCTR